MADPHDKPTLIEAVAGSALAGYIRLVYGTSRQTPEIIPGRS